MQKLEKGQVEFETIIAVSLALIMLVLVITQSQNQEQSIKQLENTIKQQSECERISSIISLMSASKSNDTVFFETQFQTTIVSNTVNLQDYYCTFTGTAQPTTIQPGKVKIYEQNGAVTVENA